LDRTNPQCPHCVVPLDGLRHQIPQPPEVAESFAHLGWPISLDIPLGVILLSCTAIYAIPRTAIFGAILLTGYLGGAVATHLRVGDPLFSHVLFPIYMGVALWAALCMRDDRLSRLIFSQD
jgi:hypothetical protein